MNEKSNPVNETHLGYIQAVIDRMGQNSFHAKEWCVTVVSALIAVYLTNDTSIAVPITAEVVTNLFAFVDAYYLHLERGYRHLYKIAAQLETDPTVKPYSMSRPKKVKGFWRYMKALFSLSTGLFYLMIVIGIAAMYIFTEVI